jgi:hypothetical protein
MNLFWKAVGFVIVICAIAVAILVVLWGSMALSRDNGQWAQSPPAIRKWFQDQRVPNGPEAGKSCCNTSDGNYAEEDIRDGNYWTRCPVDSPCPIKEWMLVPAGAVIHDPNRNGAPVVWWFYEQGLPKIRCYAPGGGV